MPILVYILGQGVHEATTASLVIVTAGALAGGYGYSRRGQVCWRHAITFTVGALPGVIAGTVLGDVVSGTALIIAFAIVMLAAAGATWRKAGLSEGDDAGSGSVVPSLLPGRELAAGVLIGVMTGFFGVGGGFLIVPTLALYLGFSMRMAIGTSLMIVVTISVMGLVAHLVAGRDFDVAVTGVMTLSCVAGGFIGGLIGNAVSQRALGRSFAILVIGVASYLLISTAVFGGPASG